MFLFLPSLVHAISHYIFLELISLVELLASCVVLYHSCLVFVLVVEWVYLSKGTANRQALFNHSTKLSPLIVLEYNDNGISSPFTNTFDADVIC